MPAPKDLRCTHTLFVLYRQRDTEQPVRRHIIPLAWGHAKTKQNPAGKWGCLAYDFQLEKMVTLVLEQCSGFNDGRPVTEDDYILMFRSLEADEKDKADAVPYAEPPKARAPQKNPPLPR